MKRYKLKILCEMRGLCETRWKDNGNLITNDGHLFLYSGETKYHRNGVGFMIHKYIKHTVMEFTPISSIIYTIKIKTKPLNIAIVHIYMHLLQLTRMNKYKTSIHNSKIQLITWKRKTC